MFTACGNTAIAVRLFLTLFVLVAANIAARTSRDAFLLQGRYASALPWLIAGTAVMLYAIVRLQELLGKSGHTRTLFLVTAVGGALTYLPFYPLPMNGFDTLIYYVWTEALNSILAVQFWLLASQALDAREAKKLFGLIGAGGAIGGLLAGLLLRPLIREFGATVLITVSAAATLLAAVLSASVPTVEEAEPSHARNEETNWNLRHPYVRILAALVIPSTLVATLVDYQFKIVAAAAIPDKNGLSAFFSTYHATVSAATLAFQIFITSFVLTKLGLLVSLLILPVSLSALSAFVPALAFAGTSALPALLYLTAASRLTDQTVKFTINHAAFQLLWLPVPALHKAKLKLDLEAVLRNGAAGIAGLALGALTAAFRPAGYTLPILNLALAMATGTMAGAWILAALRARAGYRTYLARSLENRLVDFSTDDLEIQSPEIRDNLRRALSSGEEGAVAFGLDVLQAQSLAGWESDLEAVFPATSVLIRTRILELAVRHAQLLTRETIVALCRGDESLRFRAQVIAARRKYTEIRPLLAEQCKEERYAGAIALGCLALLNNDPAAQLQLREWMVSGNAELRLAAFRAARLFPECAGNEAVISALRSDSAKLQLAALQVARQKNDSDLLRAVLPALGEARTFEAARQCLLRSSETEFIKIVADNTDFHSTPPAVLHGICRVMGMQGYAQGLAWLRQVMAQQIHETYFAAGEAIGAIIARKPRLAPDLLDELILDTLGQLAGARAAVESATTTGNGKTILDSWLTSLDKRYVHLACLFVATAAGMQSIEGLFEGRYLKPQSRSRMLELIENSLKPASRAALLPLLEKTEVPEQSPAPTGQPAVISVWLHSRSAWAQAMASLIVSSATEPRQLKLLIGVSRFGPLASEIIQASLESEAGRWKNALNNDQLTALKSKITVQGEHAMYPTLEKILLLKSVSMFKDIPVEDISDLIQVSHERQFGDGTTLFHKGDEGDQLFIVITGHIRIHRDGHELATLKRGDFLGEMALLDDEPRSADATTVGDCKMLSIGRQDFIDVLSSRPEILKGILKLLSRRLREAIARQTA